MSEHKRQQVLALGRLGWPLPRIEEETGIRRETASAYPEAAGIAVRRAGGPTGVLYRDVLAHYGAVALPCRVRDPDRKEKWSRASGTHRRRRSAVSASRRSLKAR